jgi:hypothetical protein
VNGEPGPETAGLDDLLAAVAGAPQGSEAELAAGLASLEAEHRRRQDDDLERARHAAFLDSLELEQAAYELGQRHEKEGNLRAAARWFQVAARGDHGDAALRLGEALDLLADRCARKQRCDHRAAGREDCRGESREDCREDCRGEKGEREDYGAEREQQHLIQEAAQAYAEAFAAGYTEAADKIDDMLAVYSRRKATVVSDPAPVERPAECRYVRDFTAEGQVLTEDEIRKLSRHAARCLPCMQEFIKQVTAVAAAVPTGHVHLGEVAPTNRLPAASGRPPALCPARPAAV